VIRANPEVEEVVRVRRRGSAGFQCVRVIAMFCRASFRGRESLRCECASVGVCLKGRCQEIGGSRTGRRHAVCTLTYMQCGMSPLAYRGGLFALVEGVMSEIPAGRVVARLRWIAIVLASLCLAAIVFAVRLDGPPADLLFNCGIAIVAFGIPAALAAIVAHRLESRSEAADLEEGPQNSAQPEIRKTAG
jgi:hypothetical protein